MDRLSLTATMLGAAIFIAPAASAADLKVLAGGSMTASLRELGPRFERASGHKLDMSFAATPDLIKMATSAPFDLGVVPIDVMKDAGAKAKFAAPIMDIARVGYGVAFRTGTAKPDVSTPEALKATLLNAKSITFIPASAAGAYVIRVFERLAVADAMKAKTIAQTVTAKIPEAVANG